MDSISDRMQRVDEATSSHASDRRGHSTSIFVGVGQATFRALSFSLHPTYSWWGSYQALNVASQGLRRRRGAIAILERHDLQIPPVFLCHSLAEAPSHLWHCFFREPDSHTAQGWWLIVTSRSPFRWIQTKLTSSLAWNKAKLMKSYQYRLQGRTIGRMKMRWRLHL